MTAPIDPARLLAEAEPHLADCEILAARNPDTAADWVAVRDLARAAPDLARRCIALEAERDDLRLTLLAEQGDPAGAPSEGWHIGGDGSWRKGGNPGTDVPYRVVSFGCPARHGRPPVRVWRTGDARGEAMWARDAMRRADEAADKAAEGGEG